MGYNPLDPHSITVKYPEIRLAGKPPRFNVGFPSHGLLGGSLPTARKSVITPVIDVD